VGDLVGVKPGFVEPAMTSGKPVSFWWARRSGGRRPLNPWRLSQRGNTQAPRPILPARLALVSSSSGVRFVSPPSSFLPFERLTAWTPAGRRPALRPPLAVSRTLRRARVRRCVYRKRRAKAEEYRRLFVRAGRGGGALRSPLRRGPRGGSYGDAPLKPALGLVSCTFASSLACAAGTRRTGVGVECRYPAGLTDQ